MGDAAERAARKGLELAFDCLEGSLAPDVPAELLERGFTPELLLDRGLMPEVEGQAAVLEAIFPEGGATASQVWALGCVLRGFSLLWMATLQSTGADPQTVLEQLRREALREDQ